MAEKKHTVTITTSSLELTKANVKLKIFRDGEVFGTLYVSRGAVVWKPKSRKKNFKVDWTKFDALMQTGLRTSGR
jgi:hypothetical protein